MMTVRFPNGQAIQYNNANFVTRSSEYSDLYDKKGGAWIAQVSNICVIEQVHPCRVYNALTDSTNDKLEALSKEIRSLRRKVERVK